MPDQDLYEPGPPITIRPLPEQEAIASALSGATGLRHGSRRIPAQPPNSRRLCGVVEQLYRRHEGQDWLRRGEILRNMAMNSGDQWKLFNVRTHRLEEPKRAYPHQVRIHANIIGPAVQVKVSRIGKNRPVWHVTAGTLDERDISAAKAATSSIDAEYVRLGMPRKLQRVDTWEAVAGTGILKLWWNPSARNVGHVPKWKVDPEGNPVYQISKSGSQVYQFPDGETLDIDGATGLPMPVQEMDGQGNPILEEVWEGDIECYVVSPLDLIIDDSAQDWDEVSWMLEVREVPTSKILTRWGVDVGQEPPRGQSVGSRDFVHHRVQRGEQQQTETALVKELHVQPGTYRSQDGSYVHFEHPYVVISANNKLLDHGPSPFAGCSCEFGWSPYIPFREINDPGTPWGRSIVSDLRPLQVGLNRTLSQVVESQALMGSPQWLTTTDVVTPETHFTSKPGAVIEVRAAPHGIMPKRLEGTGASAQVYRYFEVIQTLFELISGQHEGGMAGGVPAGVTAGIALEAIAERDESRFSSTIADKEWGIEQWGSKVLHLIAQGWDEERMVSVVGEGMREQVINFSGGNVTDRMRLRVVPDSAQPRTKALRNQRAMDMFQAGAFGDLRHPLEMKRAVRELRRRLGEGVGDEADDAITTNQTNAQRENREILEIGQVTTLPMIFEYEEHDIHMEVHTAALIGDEFRGNPMAQIALVQHMQMAHIPYIQMMMGMGMGMEGGPPGGAEGSGPPPPDEGGGETVPA